MIQSSTQIRVRYAETDQMNVVYHGNYAQYFEVARAELIRYFGFSYKQIEELGIMMPVFNIDIKFLRPAHYDDLITVKTELRELPNSHKMLFYHEVFNEKNELLTIGKVMLYLIDTITKQRTVLPKEMLQKLEMGFK